MMVLNEWREICSAADHPACTAEQRQNHGRTTAETDNRPHTHLAARRIRTWPRIALHRPASPAVVALREAVYAAPPPAHRARDGLGVSGDAERRGGALAW